MNIPISAVRSFALRTNSATAFDGGEYFIAEAATTDRLTDRDYTTAVGVAFRRDEMSPEAKKSRQELLDAARKGTDEFNRVQALQVCRETAKTEDEAKRMSARVEQELASA